MNAQERASISDEELTTNLLSTPGPTFRIGEAALEQSWTLIAYGDMRFTDPANEKVANPKVRRWLVDRIAREHPDVVLLSGDVPYDGSDTNDYEVFYQETRAWREARLHVYPAMGNHELHGGEVRDPKNWWHAFPELKGRRWYSVAMPHAYVISLDSNLSLLEGSRQQRWLLDQLEHLPEETLFVFLSLHHPPVADSIEGDHSHDVRPNERALAVLLEKKLRARARSLSWLPGISTITSAFWRAGSPISYQGAEEPNRIRSPVRPPTFTKTPAFQITTT